MDSDVQNINLLFGIFSTYCVFDVTDHLSFLLPGVADSSSPAEMDSCVSYLRFPVIHSMAPLSRLLVYYVRENGEGVTDSLQIHIQPDFKNQVWKQNRNQPLYVQ